MRTNAGMYTTEILITNELYYVISDNAAIAGMKTMSIKSETLWTVFLYDQKRAIITTNTASTNSIGGRFTVGKLDSYNIRSQK